MGLDINFKAIKGDQVSIEERKKTILPYKDERERKDLAYFRKVNFLVQFVKDLKNVDADEINCQDVIMKRSDIEELLDACEQVKEDNSLASQLLPTCGGFFFGSVDYDEYYFQDVEDVLKRCKEILEYMDKNPSDVVVFHIWF